MINRLTDLLNEAFLVRKGKKEAMLKIKICSKFSRPPMNDSLESQTADSHVFRRMCKRNKMFQIVPRVSQSVLFIFYVCNMFFGSEILSGKNY